MGDTHFGIRCLPRANGKDVEERNDIEPSMCRDDASCSCSWRRLIRRRTVLALTGLIVVGILFIWHMEASGHRFKGVGPSTFKGGGPGTSLSDPSVRLPRPYTSDPFFRRPSYTPTPSPVFDRPTSPPPPGGGGGPRPLTPTAAVVLSVCIATHDLSPECRERTPEQAAGALSQYLVGKYVQRLAINLVIRSISVSFRQPELFAGLSKQQAELVKVELTAINLVAQQLKTEVQSLKPLDWDTEEQRRKKLEVIRRDEHQLDQWQEEARLEARAGSNWTESSTGTFKYSEGLAHRQLKQISIGGWGGL